MPGVLSLMSPSTPAYRAVPNSPPSTFSTPDTLVNSTPRHDDREKPHASRYPSSRMRIRPLPVILGVLGLLLLAGPILHPTPRAAIHTYLHSHNAPPPYDGAQPPTGGLDPAVVPMTLEARLSYLMDRPALDHNMAELPSRYGCPSLTYNRDWYFFHNEKKGQWEHLTGGDVLRYRNKLVEYLRTVEREGGKLVWEDGMDSHVPSSQRRGLIFTAGDGPALERLKLTLHMLRNVVKSKIITHIYHFKGELEEPGLKDGFAEKYDVQFVEVGGRRQDGKSWNIKNIAFLHTQFTEFVYMDSDNIPLGDPLDLFDSVEYQQSGSVFWSDLNKDHPDNFIWRVLGRPCSDIHWPAEAGQLVFDKRGNNGLNLAVLHLSAHMMAEEQMYGQLGYGDKDTFRYSFYMLGLDYQMAPRQFASAGGYQDDQGQTSEDFCGHTMLQWGLTPPDKRYDPEYHPRPMFLHTILAKHRYNLQPEKLFTHYKRPRLDGMTEPTLVRTYYEWTGSCFAIDLKGPDGAPGTKMGWGDGQGTELNSLAELIDDRFVYDELQGISKVFVNIAH